MVNMWLQKVIEEHTVALFSGLFLQRQSNRYSVLRPTPRYSAAAECSSQESTTSIAAFRDGSGRTTGSCVESAASNLCRVPVRGLPTSELQERTRGLR